MGIFERIRQASPWVLTTFAIVFVGFMVLGDMDFSSLQTAQNNPENRIVAEVGEKNVGYLEFENMVREEIAAQRQQARQQGKNAPEVDENSIRRAVFSNLVDTKILEIKAEKMGVNITDKVVGDYMIAYPPQSFVQSFSDSNGFRRDIYLRYITNPEGFANDMVSQNQNAQPGQAQKITQDIRERLKKVSSYLEDQLIQSSVQIAMMEAGSFLSKEYLKEKYINENSYADFEMIYLKTSSVADTEIEITESGLQEFYNKYSENYRQEAQRKVKYASFKLEPSKQDSSNAERKLQKIKRLLSKAQSKNEAQKLFKDASFEYGGEMTDLVPFNQLDAGAKGYLRGAEEGDIVGPAKTQEGTNYYRVVKIDSGDVSEVKASHILVNFDDNKDSAYKAAIQLYQRAKRGEDFATLAIENSKDRGSAPRGGDLGYFGKGKMVPEFEEAAFKAEVGEITKPVESQFGYHIIKVEDKVSKRYQVETISIAPKIGSNTKKQARLKAKEFADRAKSGEDFDKLAEELGAAKGETAPFFEQQPILGSGYITSFAFKNDKGEVSRPLELDNFGVTVVMVSEVIPAGIPDLETVKGSVEYLYKQKLKKDKLEEKAKKIYDAVSQSGNMQDAKKVDNQITIKNITNNKNTGMIKGVQGREKVVTSAVFNQEIGDISRPIRANTGYFIVKTKAKSLASDKLVEKNLDDYIEKEIEKEKRGGFYKWFQESKKDIEIIDKRSEIYTKY